MRFKGKKPIASYKDTWCVDSTLRPIIAEALRKFLEVKENPNHSDYFGVPGVLSDAGSDIKELGVRSKEWDEILHKIHWAFDTPEPDIRKYDFEIKMIPVEGTEHRYKTEVVNQEEYDRYEQDLEDYWKKRTEGYELLGKYLFHMWW